MIPRGLARVLFAERDGAVIAARNFGVYKQGASTWTAAGLGEAGPVGANVLLQWEAMRSLAEEGLEVMDCGEAFPGAGDAKLRQLSDFKKSFGGTLRPYYKGRLDLRGRWMRRYDALRQ
jgi:lipid II:glycine glycyltransferase (peptidoglycan interpeptide bridge formation enzyme)